MLHRVAMLVLDDFATMDVGIPGQFFGIAEDADRRKLYDVRTCTPGGGPVRCAAGYAIVPDHDLSLLEDADTVIVPGVHGGLPFEGSLEPGVAEALRAVAGRKRIVSICTGAFVLAAAGLLDGRAATTHWRNANRFRRLYPDVLLNPEVLFVDDGDILTSAGVAAGTDLALHIIRSDFGTEVANRVARRCVTAPFREGGQAQFIERPLPPAQGASTESTRAWMLSRLAEPLDLNALAAHARMSVRTFTRRFREETGLSPARWLNRQRVEHARRLLETTGLPVDEVARQAGFGTAVSLRQHLHAAVGVSPIAYRQTFRPQAALRSTTSATSSS
ncbi:helix-turn-helix domain-containing protein [Herbidospora galbida]|uniref:Helix-turn-helix domain-containing protein n=1 Tax=Herbidospora galbida TaxID=2575442 RepID=A0A4U3MF28_9ACTN|nr:helix-turn-helix domain-containing protein [Herbidospora galbida]TKK87998.1 helix-turn-helix domain-containing protein [Herbidospora galbida]